MPRLSLNSRMVAFGLLLLATTLGAAASRVESGEMLVRYTVRLGLAWYATTLLLMMRLTAADWSATSTLGQVARWCWTWGAICFFVHMVMAFHFYHYWSHEHAYDVTRDVSGVGEGIYTLYLFIGLWLGDVAWWWFRPWQYAMRSSRIDQTLHAFMLFIVFNGMIVFESGTIRWAGAILFVVLAVAWVSARGMPRLRAL